MPKRLYRLLAFLCFALPCFAQSGPVTANLTASAASCTPPLPSFATTACLFLPVGNTTGTVVATLSGTFSATAQFEGTGDNVTWSSVAATPLAGGSSVTSATGTGNWQINAQGLLYVRIRVSSYASGTVIASINPSKAATANLGGGSSSSGTVTSVTFTGDGIFDSSTPSSAVTTSGTVTATAISQTGNCFFASPSNGSSGAPSCRAIVNADIPTLNQNTTGTAGGLSGTPSITINALSATTINVPASAGATAGTGGTIAYDTTNKNTHCTSNNADALCTVEATAILISKIPKSASSTVAGFTASSITDNGTDVTMAEPLFGASGTLLTTPTTITSTTLVTTGLALASAPASSTAGRGECHIIWEQSTAAATVTFGVGLSATATGLWVQPPIIWNGTTETRGSYVTLTTATTSNITSTITPAATATGYALDIAFGLSTNTNTNVVTIYGLTSSGSDALVIEPGSYCEWLP